MFMPRIRADRYVVPIPKQMSRKYWAWGRMTLGMYAISLVSTLRVVNPVPLA